LEFFRGGLRNGRLLFFGFILLPLVELKEGAMKMIRQMRMVSALALFALALPLFAQSAPAAQKTALFRSRLSYACIFR